MTCEKCYHNEVCKALYELNGIPRIGATECAYFRDKDRLIEAPLWVGQTVYSYNHYLGGVFAYSIDNVGIGSLGKSGVYWGFEANCHDEETDELLDEIDFDLDYIGKTVFLTREAAEAALEARNDKP